MLGAMDERVRLTTLSHGAGCACKLSPQDLGRVLEDLPPVQLPSEVMVSSETRDDAAVYRLPDGHALVHTVDFFTPIVDDPFDWGRIAAANAVSDVYAMGARPVLALNLVAWAVDDLPLDMLGRVLEGGQKIAAEAGFAIVGGHSIHDPEPKYGMAVTGLAEADRIVRSSTAPREARLFLTKPLGTGLIATAIKRERATEAQVAAAVATMTELNSAASEAMLEAGAEAATDVTGFGFLGHLHNMARGSGVAAEVDAAAIPLLDGALDLASASVVPGGTRKNLAYLDDAVDWGPLPEPERIVLADAQTSGGLLIAATDGDAVRDALVRRGVPAAEIGRTVQGEPGRITVRGRVAG
jgi:selenide, water dikinase